MQMELIKSKGVCEVGLRDAPAHVRIFVTVLLWILIMWLFTIGYPGFVPIAKFIIVIIILPYAMVEWLKEKQVITRYLLAYRLVALTVGALIWHYLIR